MLTELTPDQIAQLDIYAEKWRAIGLSTEPVNRSEAEHAIEQYYQQVHGKPKPTIHWLTSPQAMVKTVFTSWKFKQYQKWLRTYDNPLDGEIPEPNIELTNRVDQFFAQQLGGFLMPAMRLVLNTMDSRIASLGVVYGQHRAGIYAYHDYMDVVLDRAVSRNIINIEGQVSQHCGWWLPYQHVCYVTERPKYFRFDDENRLHCEEGMAITYRDGWGIYAWHGIAVPEYVVMRFDEITPKKILKEDNAEVARVMLERYGQDNFIRDGGFTHIQSDDYGALYRVDFANGDEPIVAVKVKDASSDREYFLFVPPHIQSAHEGVAWSFGYDNVIDYNPNRET